MEGKERIKRKSAKKLKMPLARLSDLKYLDQESSGVSSYDSISKESESYKQYLADIPDYLKSSYFKSTPVNIKPMTNSSNSTPIDQS